jgi:hypothetical protein
MKRLILAAAIAAAATPALAQNVGMSVTVGQPGFYGRIDIGNFPQPMVIYPQPIYLHVPPGHAKDWRKHCGRYNACGQPVYFVQEGWYNNVYVPRYQPYYGYGQGGQPGKGHGKGKKHD